MEFKTFKRCDSNKIIEGEVYQEYFNDCYRYVAIHKDQLPDSDAIFLEDELGFRYKRVIDSKTINYKFYVYEQI